MGAAPDHLNRARYNEDLANFLLDDQNAQRENGSHRWAVVAYHYAARELCHAYLDKHQRDQALRHPKGHGELSDAMARTLRDPQVTGSLQVLRDMSEGARYLDEYATDDTWWKGSYPTPRDAAQVAADEYGAIRRTLMPLTI